LERRAPITYRSITYRSITYRSITYRSITYRSRFRVRMIPPSLP
jgi:hypothetical protein